MKALFLVFHGFAPHNGISKKITYQLDAFRNNGLDMKLCYMINDINGSLVRMIDDVPLVNFGRGIKAKLLKRVEYHSLIKYIFDNEIRYVYMRSDHNANPFTVFLIKKLKKKGVIVDMEIPTYPYDKEYIHFGLYDKFTLLIDRLFRKKIAQYLHRIVTFTDSNKIFGRETIRISNGIDFTKIRIKDNNSLPTDCFNLIAVAEIHFWHGFDRIVSGLVEYYKTNPKTKVFLHLVGEGVQDELEVISKIATDGNVDSFIVYHGQLWGDELDLIFDISHFGIASLGRHRSGIVKIKTLKNREYAARGIPFIYSEIDEDFENMPYIMKASPDNTPISITSIIDFYNKRIFSPLEIRSSIEEKLSWNFQVKIILNHIGID